MTTSFYDLSVGSFMQAVSGVQRTLEKGAVFAAENDLNPDNFVVSRLHDDMLPFLFQVNCIGMHTVDALDAIRAGEYTPPKTTEQRNYAELQQFLNDIKQQLKDMDEAEINGLAGKTIIFKFGGNEMPFTAENFIMSFSIPNLNFHATTAYDILRHNGVPLGKADYLGRMRIGV